MIEGKKMKEEVARHNKKSALQNQMVQTQYSCPLTRKIYSVNYGKYLWWPKSIKSGSILEGFMENVEWDLFQFE